MAALTVQSMARTAVLTPTYAAAAGGGDTVPNDGSTFLHFKNGSGAPITVSVAVQGKVDGLTPAARTYIIPAGGDGMFGPFPVDNYNNSTQSLVLTYSGVTTLTVAAIRHGT